MAGKRAVLFAAVGAVAIVRLWMCARTPENTADLLRSIHVALYVLRDGPSVVGTPLLELDPGLQALSWAHTGYSYPPLVFPFFVLVAALSPTLFAAKVGLTLVEAANAVLVARVTGRQWMGAAYWALPGSIWWVSGEGQFEPLMALCMLGAVAMLRAGPAAVPANRRPLVAAALLGLGVNVKLTAGLLLPWLLWEVVRREGDAGRGRPAAALVATLGAFAAAVVAPLFVAGLWYPVVEGMTGIPETVRYNPYYWNPLDPGIFRWNPGWLRVSNAAVSIGAIAFLAWLGATRRVAWPRLAGALAFLGLLKVSSLAQFWYLVLFPAFVMPTEGKLAGVDVRWWLLALTPLLDLRSLAELVVGPFGWSEAAVYEGINAFTPFGIR